MSPFLITQKIGIVQQLEVENASVRWHLGEGRNSESRYVLAVEIVYIGICVSAALNEATIERTRP
jgi:hypothetical protein